MTAAFWDKRAQTYNEDIEDVQKHDGRYNQTINATQELFIEADVVLDFGCASGEMSLDNAPHVQQVQGIDLSSKMLALAKLWRRKSNCVRISSRQSLKKVWPFWGGDVPNVISV